MAELTDITGIDAQAIRLLEALRIYRSEELAAEDTPQLYARLYQTNKEQEIYDRMPAIETIEEWVAKARDLTGVEPDTSSGSGSGSESSPIPTPSNRNRDSLATEIKTPVDEEWIEYYEQAPEATVLEPPATTSANSYRQPFERPFKPSDPTGDARPAPVRPRLTKRGTIDPKLGSHRMAEDKEASIIAGTSQEKEPLAGAAPGFGVAAPSSSMPKRAIRGLVHPRRHLTTFGFIVAIVTRLLVVAMFIGAPIALVFFSDYMLYFAVIPAALLIFALLYAVYASKIYCRVCGTAMLVPQKAHKHEKAHHLVGLGYIASMALHGLRYGWFRCPHCGTAMRLKS